MNYGCRCYVVAVHPADVAKRGGRYAKPSELVGPASAGHGYLPGDGKNSDLWQLIADKRLKLAPSLGEAFGRDAEEILKAKFPDLPAAKLPEMPATPKVAPATPDVAPATPDVAPAALEGAAPAPMEQVAIGEPLRDRMANHAETSGSPIQPEVKPAAPAPEGDNGGMKYPPRTFPDAEQCAAFYQSAVEARHTEAKLPLSKLTNVEAISRALGKAVDVDEIVLQASYLGHVHDFHGPGGIRQDRHPVTAEDIALAAIIINGDPDPVFKGETTHAGNPLVKFTQVIEGVTYKVVGEVRTGKKNRNIAVFNFYKR